MALGKLLRENVSLCVDVERTDDCVLDAHQAPERGGVTFRNTKRANRAVGSR